MTEPRKKLTLGQTVTILRRQAICPLCRELLGDVPLTDEHLTPRELGGSDELHNRAFVHSQPCAKVKTFGPPTKTNTRGTDIGEIAHTRRLSKDEEAFRVRLLTKEPGKPSTRPPSRLRSRGFEKRPTR